MLKYASRPRQTDEGNERTKQCFIVPDAEIIMYISGYEQWTNNLLFKESHEVPNQFWTI